MDLTSGNDTFYLYIGLIGSKRRTTIVIDRLREKGATDEQLRKIHAPIGLDIGAVSPEEVALAIIAVPVIVRTTEDMLRLVPGSLREAGAALGASVGDAEPAVPIGGRMDFRDGAAP